MSIAAFPIAAFPIAGSGFVSAVSPPPNPVPTRARSRGCRVRTAGDVINAAMKRILVQGADGVFQADEYADAIDTLNDYMYALEARGVMLGFQSVSNVADPVMIPEGAYRGIIANLAIELAPDFNGVVSQALVSQANTGMDTIELLALRMPQTSFPTTLPIGSGSEWNDPFALFYADALYANLSLVANACYTTFEDDNTSVPIVGTWKQNAATFTTSDLTGVITCQKAGIVKATLEVRILTTTSITGLVIITNNDYTAAYEEFTTTANEYLDVTVELSSLEVGVGEFLSANISNSTNTDSILVTDAQWVVQWQ